MTPAGWTEESEEIILRDGDLEEPPAFVSGHDKFLEVQVTYEGWDDVERADE